MKSRNDSLEKGLRSIDPLDGEEMNRLSSENAQLLAAILASGRDEATRSPRSLRDRVLPPVRRRRLLAAIPLAAVALVALVVGMPGGSGGAQGTLPALARVAQAAAAQTPPSSDLPYLFVKTREEVTSGTAANGRYWLVHEPAIREVWIAEDGSGRVREIVGPSWFVGPEHRAAWEAAGRIDFLAHGWGRHTSEVDFPAGHFRDSLYDGVELAALPTDPAELAAWLERRVSSGESARNGNPFPVKTLILVAELLNNPLATPELRAALYEAEGRIPGIEYLGEATDAIGRRGVAVGVESASSGVLSLYSLIFDPRTSQVLAYEQTPREAAPASPGEIDPPSATLFIESGRTRALGGATP
jgi:hypothetical protein